MNNTAIALLFIIKHGVIFIEVSNLEKL